MSKNQSPDHDPDGVPHSVVGLSVLATFAIATGLLGVVASGRTGTAIAMLFVAVPCVVGWLDKRARRYREAIASMPRAALRKVTALLSRKSMRDESSLSVGRNTIAR